MIQRNNLFRILPLLLACMSCTATVGPWKFESIAAGNPDFNSARLVYFDPDSEAPFRLEFLRTGVAVDLFLSLSRYTIAPSSLDPSSASVRFTIGDEVAFDESVPLLEGRMRLRFPHETTERITNGLQEGKKVTILVDGFEETLQPEFFSKLYEKLTGSAAFIRNPFKGILE